MIVCAECGNSAPSRDGFCSSCGVLLEWSGETVAVTVPPASVATATAAPTTVAPNGAAFAPTIAAAPQATTAGGGVTRIGASAPAPLAPPFGPPPAPSFGPPPAPLSGPPTALQPAPEAVRPAPVPLVADPVFDGLYCSACGARNASGRNFCRLCGEGLEGAWAPESDRPWWRRLLGRRARVTVAGERPDGFNRREARVRTKRSRWSPRRLNLRGKLPLSKIAPLLIVLGLMGYGLGPGRLWVNQHLNGLIGKAKAHVSTTLVPVTPVSATASTSAPGHDPKLAIDGVKGTWWQSGDPHTAIGQSLTVTFANPVDIDRVGLLSGSPDAAFRTTARVQTLAIAADGNAAKQVNFSDTADFQNATTSLRGVRSLTIVIVSDFPGQANPAAAIRELQFDRTQIGS